MNGILDESSDEDSSEDELKIDEDYMDDDDEEDDDCKKSGKSHVLCPILFLIGTNNINIEKEMIRFKSPAIRL